MQNHNQKHDTTTRVQEIHLRLLELQSNPGFSQAQEVIISVVELFGIRVPERGRFSFVKDSKFIKNEPWFLWHEIVTDKRAAEVLKHEEGIPIEIKTYWLNKIASDRIKGIVHFSDNYEDNKRTRDDQHVLVGIDFLVHPKGDAITVALSNNGNVRVLELKGKLNNTQKKILASWIEIGDGDQKFNREYLHSSLWNSFELKSVNQNFYDVISKAFTELKDHFDNQKIIDKEESKKFSNRLLSRLLFVWFLRKKGFISEEKITYFDTGNQTDAEYYFEKLEKLFFETLNKPFELRDGLLDDLKTPYLNGGLFNKQENDKLSKNTSFPPAFFARLYRNLDEYNFTTDESTPDFEQVAIDPEMLGRVFENLLASMSDETGEQARKAKGAFYTPRAIVQYMCRESLKNYLYSQLGESEYKLEIDRLINTPDFEWANNESNKTRDISNKGDFGKKAVEALKKLKSIDPACGSGAFPIGMLQELMRIYGRLNRTANEYEIKLTILENNIYGVDIDPMAIEISRLRAFLALVVDQEYNEKNKNGGIDTLPNLEFKFVCANSLLTLDKQEQLYDGLTPGKKGKQINLENELMDLKKKYFKADYQKKQELEIKLDQLLNTAGLFESKKYQQLRTYHPIKQIIPASFYEPKLMHDVENLFDIVIGNPPYVQLQKNGGHLANLYKDLDYKTFARTGDIYALFYERGLELTTPQTGLLCYITSNKWMRAGYGEKLRAFFARHNPLILLDLGGGVFESATVDSNILLIQNSENKGKTKSLTIKNNKIDLFDQVEKESTEVSFMHTDAWFIGNQLEINLKNKIEENGIPLKDLDVHIYRGILTGLNEAFIIDEQKKNELIARDPKSAEIIKPILRGRDIKRYGYEFADLYIINSHNGVREKSIEPININNFTAVRKHLDQFEPQLSARQDKGNTPYNLRNCAYIDEFEKEKIVWGNISYDNSFTLLKKDVFLNAPGNLITSDSINLYFLIGCLNSKVFNWEFKQKGIFLGKAYEWKKQYVEEVHVPRVKNIDFESKIKEIVTQIQEKKKNNIKADTSDLESQIDELIMDLYGLNEEEKEVIRNS
jgi:hypothetical protein